jgi:hypothetical protein
MYIHTYLHTYAYTYKPISQCCDGDILSQRKKRNKTCETVKRLKGAKLEDLENLLVIWMVQFSAKNGTVPDEVVKEQVKMIGQQMGGQICIQTMVCVLLQENYYIEDGTGRQEQSEVKYSMANGFKTSDNM